MLKAKGIDIGYKNKTVLHDINIEMNPGQLICLLGPNGVGKTTFMKCLGGFLKPQKGEIFIDTHNIHKMTDSQLACKISVVLTGRITASNMTVFDIVSMGRYPYTGLMGILSQNDKNIVMESLKSVGIEHLKDRFITETSDGEYQKVMIAKALAQQPEVMLLDEAVGHLDAKNRFEILLLLRNLAHEKNVTVVMILHEVDLALRLCDMVVLVEKGGVKSYGPPEDVLTEKAVKELYNVDKAGFCRSMGTLELKCDSNKSLKVHVLSGKGKGAPIIRALTRHGYKISVGPLAENDVDYFVSKTADTIVYELNDIPALIENLKESDVIIDVDFSFDGDKLIILNELKNLNIPIYSFRNQKEVQYVYGGHDIKTLNSVEEMLKSLKLQQGIF
ncbi:ABC transporter ATP-binding protein [Aceticella autotrophica]|uniref:ABC transporter ATP-binding protein n=1 Tax=Aceticella autotrophica TaxID=2755338 RepID=A0A975G9Z2_9THEO|nr:ABC transporter ATP-binding protein [Aceticella autotrophica]QSZ26830.1 ABC transporter ATP-binding protein [Aceticella autotrophica]